MWARRAQGRQHGARGQPANAAALLVILLQRINGLDRKPPLTLGLMALMYALHYQKMQTPFRFRRYSLCPDKVVHDHDVMRLLASALLHGDDMHLYHNMVSLLWKGYHLEYQLGSARFATAIGALLVLSQALVVAVTFVLATGFNVHEPFYQCSVGFSGVLFALKVLLNHNAPTFTSVYGVHVPTKYAAWLELVAIHVLVPRSSFMGHMCGILAGYIYVLSPRIQAAGTSIVTSVTRWFQFIAISPETLETRAAPHSHASATLESDAMLAQRLQDEEYRAAGAEREQMDSDHNDATLHVASISQEELRRRRLERLSHEPR